MVGACNIVTPCGSTYSHRELEETKKRLTLADSIVINVGLCGIVGTEEVWEGVDEDAITRTWLMLDDIHKGKIDMADEIFVISVGSYAGSGTRSEIAYAHTHGTPMRDLALRWKVRDSFEPAARALRRSNPHGESRRATRGL